MFVLTMDALNALFQLIDNRSLFCSLHVPSIRHRLSLYADDLVIFTVLDEQDLRLVRVILVVFAGPSGLHTNISKCHSTVIQCSTGQIELVQLLFPC
jgi:hypothetical protein